MQSIVRLLAAIYKSMSGIFYETREIGASIVMMVLYKSAIEGSVVTDVALIDWAIRIGMLIIIWYGVIKIF